MCHPDSIPEQQEQEIVCPTSKFGSSSSSTSSSSLSSSSAKNSNRIAKVREWSQILQYLPTPDNELSQEGYSAAASATATATAISANDIDQAYARMEAIHAELHAFLESDGNEQEGSLPLDSDQILALTSEFRACYRTFLQGNNAELDAFAASDISAKAELSSGKEEEGQAEPAEFIPYQVDPELLRRVEERLAAATKPVAIITRTTRNSVDFVLPYKENPDYANSNSISGNAGAMPIPDYANAKIIHSQYIHVTTRWLDPQYQNQNQNQHQQQQQQQETTDVLLMVTSTTPSGTTTRTIVRGGNAVSTTTTNNADININISSSSTNSSTDVISSDLFAQYLFGGYRCAITRQQQQQATTATTATTVTTVTTATTKDNGGTTTTRRKARRKSARLRVVPLHKKKRNNSNNNNNNRTSCASDNKNNSNNDDDDDDSSSNSNSSKKKPRTEDSHNNNNININEEQEQEQQEQHGGK